MARIVNVAGRKLAEGTTSDLIGRMVLQQIKHAKMRPANQRRYAESVVRAAIRRDGYTDANQRLMLSPSERQEWEAANPLED
jgi:glycine betaine/choline ABC-type transport system substrate-binding protein